MLLITTIKMVQFLQLSQSSSWHLPEHITWKTSIDFLKMATSDQTFLDLGLEDVPCRSSTPTNLLDSHHPKDLHCTAAPKFQDLQRAIYSDCQQMTVPFTLISTPVTFPVPYQVRLASLQTRIFQATSSVGDIPELQQLRTFCQHQSYHIDIERNQSLQLSLKMPWLFQNINSYHDYLQHQLVDRIESSLNLLLSCHHRTQPQQTSPTALPSSHEELVRTLTAAQKVLARKKKSPSLNPTAVKIMTLWYKRNEAHPYPTQSTAEVMAKAGGIRAEQVKKWFANKRKRSGNTKPFKEITTKRRCSRVASSQSLLLTGVSREWILFF